MIPQVSNQIQRDSETINLYGHAECPHVQRIRALLDRNRIAFQYIGIRVNEPGRLHVMEINQGYESVPTLIFSDDTTLTEPSRSSLCKKLNSMSYECRRTGWFHLVENLIRRFVMY